MRAKQMVLMWAAGLLAVGVSGAGWVGDEDPETARLYQLDELRTRLNEPKLRILDVRSKEAYQQGHIPGAVWVDEAAAQKLAARPGGLVDREAWVEWVAPLGIDHDAEVVVVDGARQLSAARVWWLLTYLGVPRVGLLNGNMGAWEEAGHPVSKEVPSPGEGTFTVSLQPERHATRAEVLAALKDEKSQVLDARSRGEYTGAEAKSKRGGHIPEACHLEWVNMVDEKGRFLEPGALRAKLAAAGIRPGARVISHCQGGGRASVNAFVLERLGYPTRNYYLGWSDWGNADETPVVK